MPIAQVSYLHTIRVPLLLLLIRLERLEKITTLNDDDGKGIRPAAACSDIGRKVVETVCAFAKGSW